MPKKVKKALTKLGIRDKKNTIRIKIARTVPFIVLFIMVVWGFAWVHKSLEAAKVMELQGIRIAGVEKIHPGELLKLTGLKKGINMLDIDLDQLVSAALKHPRVRTVTFKKVFPNRLEIQVEERKPALQLYLPDSQKYFLIDKDGVLLPDTAEESFDSFLIFKDKSIWPIPAKTGERYTSEHISEAVEFVSRPEIQAILEHEKIDNLQVNEIGFWSFTTEDGVEFRLGENLENLNKLGDIEALLESDARKNLEYLDLRFQDVIVKVKQKRKK